MITCLIVLAVVIGASALFLGAVVDQAADKISAKLEEIIRPARPAGFFDQMALAKAKAQAQTAREAAGVAVRKPDGSPL